VIVGAGEVRHNPNLDGPFEPREPAAIMARAVALALGDLALAGAVAGVVEHLDLLACVEPMAWTYDDTCARVGRLAGLNPDADHLTVPPGGNSPGDLLNETADRIVAGEVDLAVLAGSEAMLSRRRAARESIELDWPRSATKRDFLGGQRPFSTDLETRHGVWLPIHAYPLIESAVRARSGRSVEEHQRFLGALMARNTEVAAANPHAWFPTALSADDIVTPTDDNRMVCFPYTKRMNSILDVDMGAAIVVMSDQEADRRGVPADRRVTFLGGGSASDAWTVSERRHLDRSPGIAAAAGAALDHAGITVDRVDAFDLYSCFPSAIELAIGELGVEADDPRGLTVTGGLAYAGGPGNSYSMHGLAAMTRRLREDPAVGVGLVSSLGMTASKHAYNVLAADGAAFPDADGRAERRQPPASEIEEDRLVDRATGPATVEASTVEYDRSGAPGRTVYVLRLDDGRRTLANGSGDPAEVAALTTSESVGRRGTLSAGPDGTNHFALD
jgi:acetyl-CoA C-acetyltransferase